MSKQSRRQFLATTVAASAAPFILDSHIRAQERRGQGPNNRINLGFIGIGMMGRGHLDGFLRNQNVQVVAVCDVHRVRREDAVARVHRAYAAARKAGTYTGCTAFVDFRELLARRDIDAVVIATPDHWHAIPSILAARARKDVYCEKPLSLTIAEGRAREQHRLPDRQPAAHRVRRQLPQGCRVCPQRTHRPGAHDPHRRRRPESAVQPAE